MRVGFQLHILKHLHHFLQNGGVFVKKRFVVDIEERKIAVREKFELTKIRKNFVPRCVRVVLEKMERVADFALVNIGDFLAKKFLHAFLVELLQPIL